MGITPTLLLIVPTLNSYKVLPRLINSLKSQIFVDWSLLLVDGPSNNDHKLYLDNCCKNDKRIIITPHAGGSTLDAHDKVFGKTTELIKLHLKINGL